jgi:hypothetical protein
VAAGLEPGTATGQGSVETVEDPAALPSFSRNPCSDDLDVQMASIGGGIPSMSSEARVALQNAESVLWLAMISGNIFPEPRQPQHSIELESEAPGALPNALDNKRSPGKNVTMVQSRAARHDRLGQGFG